MTRNERLRTKRLLALKNLPKKVLETKKNGKPVKRTPEELEHEREVLVLKTSANWSKPRKGPKGPKHQHLER